MRRLIINCLLLASIASAVPDGRHKRDFTFIKNLITSTLFGGNQRDVPPFPNLEEPEYKLYRVPGFNDILIKAIPSLPAEATVLNRPGEVLEIHPFESYIGTENTQDTALAFETVNNLLATEILNKQQSNLLQKTMVPMISGLNTINIVNGEDVRPVPIISETIRPMLTKVEIPYGGNVLPGMNTANIVAKKTVKPVRVVSETVQPVVSKVNTRVKLQLPFEPKYSYKQLEKNVPVMTFSQHGAEVSVRQKIDATSSIPMCIKQRIDEVVSLGANPHRVVPIKGGLHYEYHQAFPFNSRRVPSAVSNKPLQVEVYKQAKPESRKIVVQKTVPLKPVVDFVEQIDVRATFDDSFESSHKEYDKIEIFKTLGPIPPQFSSSFNTKLSKESKSGDSKSNGTKAVKSAKTIAETAVKRPKDGIVSHYAYRHVSHNSSQTASQTKHSNKSNTNINTDSPLPSHYVYIPPVLDSTPKNKHNTNVVKSPKPVSKITQDTPKDKKVPNYVYKQINSNGPITFGIAKDKDDASLFSPRTSVSPTDDSSSKSPNAVNIIKSTSISKDNTVSNFVYKQVSHNNPKAFSIAKEKEEMNTGSPLSNHYVQIPHRTSLLPTVTSDSNIRMGTKNTVGGSSDISKNETLSQYIYKQVSHNNPHAFSILEEKDLAKPDTNNGSPSPQNYVYVPPVINSGPIMLNHSKFLNPFEVKAKDTSIVKTAANVGKNETLSQYIYKQVTHNNPHVLRTLEEKKPLDTNIFTSLSLPTQYGTPNIINTPPPLNVEKTDAELPKDSFSQYFYKQVNHNNQSVFSMVKDGDELKTNTVTDLPLSVDTVYNPPDINMAPVSYTTVKEDDVLASSETESEALTIGSKYPSILKENDRDSFKDNPIVVADSSYTYHQSNVDGSSVSVKGSKDGVHVNVNDKSAKGRGDIPGQ